MIVAGQLVDHLGFCTFAEPVLARGRGFDTRLRHELRTADIDTVDPGCPITRGHHGAQVGTLAHLEQTIAGDVYAVLDVGSLDSDCDDAGRVYLSLQGETCDGRLRLRSIALTGQPAMSVSPVTIVAPGRLRDLVSDEHEVKLRARGAHFLAGLLEHARAAQRARTPGEPVMVRRATSSQRSDDGPLPTAPPRSTPVFVDGVCVSATWIRGGGRIIDVR